MACLLVGVVAWLSLGLELALGPVSLDAYDVVCSRRTATEWARCGGSAYRARYRFVLAAAFSVCTLHSHRQTQPESVTVYNTSLNFFYLNLTELPPQVPIELGTQDKEATGLSNVLLNS